MSAIPDLEGFRQESKKGNLIPVYRTLSSDTLTPVSAFTLIEDNDNAFLFESVVGGEKIARYSFLGSAPFITFSAKGSTVKIIENNETQTLENANPWDELEKIMARFTEVKRADLPPFMGGAVGYAGYDSIRFIENITDAGNKTAPLSEFYFGFYDQLIAFDHITKTIKIIALADTSTDSVEDAYAKAIQKLDQLTETLKQPVQSRIHELRQEAELALSYESNFTKEGFEDCVRTAQKHILKGDIFQVVLSQRLETKTEKAPFDVYRVLRTVNPSPYMFYLKTSEGSLVGASPEVMVRVEEGKVTLRPIAGTRPRGRDEAEDQALAEELLADEKEVAEHVMLMDLGRNDVGRVAQYNSVVLDEKMIIEKYSHVMHIVSNVSGKLRDDKNAFDTIKACLPAGTLSGAPKVRAMEIIEQLEPHRRGVYGGAVGYFDFSGNADTCIAIRTIVFADNVAYIQSGAGIVLDSVPANEYQETLNKAKAVLKAIELA